MWPFPAKSQRAHFRQAAEGGIPSESDATATLAVNADAAAAIQNSCAERSDRGPQRPAFFLPQRWITPTSSTGEA